MPRHAIRDGHVDLVLSPEEIANELNRIADRNRRLQAGTPPLRYKALVHSTPIVDLNPATQHKRSDQPLLLGTSVANFATKLRDAEEMLKHVEGW